MKILIYLFVFISFLFSNACMGDVININYHYLDKCVKITNMDEYPEISLVGAVIPPNDPFNTEFYILTSSECLPRNFRNCDFNIYALSKDYLKGKDLQEIDFSKNPNALASNIIIIPVGDYINDSIPISSIQQYYKIAGFSNSSVILYKWREVITFNNGKPDSTSTYNYDGDVSQLYQKIQVGINSKQNPSSFEVYPNPAQKNFHLKINNSHHGPIRVELRSSESKIVKSLAISKTGSILDTDINVENLGVGTYYVSVKFGEMVESKKIVIK